MLRQDVIHIFFLLVCAYHPYALPTSTLPSFFSFTTSSTWKDFTLNTTSTSLKKRWVWTELVIIKSTEPINLQKLTLLWNGEHINNMQASLYSSKGSHAPIVPIAENLLCDGEWNAPAQELTFMLNKKVVAKNTYYLMLRFSEKDLHKIKHGSFILPSHAPIMLTKLT